MYPGATKDPNSDDPGNTKVSNPDFPSSSDVSVVESYKAGVDSDDYSQSIVDQCSIKSSTSEELFESAGPDD